MPRKRQLKTERQRRLLSKSPTSSWVSARDSLRLETGTMPIWYVACARPCYQSSAPVLNTCCQQIMSHLPALYAPSYEALRELMLDVIHVKVEPFYRSMAAFKVRAFVLTTACLPAGGWLLGWLRMSDCCFCRSREPRPCCKPSSSATRM